METEREELSRLLKEINEKKKRVQILNAMIQSGCKGFNLFVDKLSRQLVQGKMHEAPQLFSCICIDCGREFFVNASDCNPNFIRANITELDHKVFESKVKEIRGFYGIPDKPFGA